MMVTKVTCTACNKEFEHDMAVAPVVCPHCQAEYKEEVKTPDAVTAPKGIIGGE